MLTKHLAPSAHSGQSMNVRIQGPLKQPLQTYSLKRTILKDISDADNGFHTLVKIPLLQLHSPVMEGVARPFPGRPSTGLLTRGLVESRC